MNTYQTVTITLPNGNTIKAAIPPTTTKPVTGQRLKVEFGEIKKLPQGARWE